MVKKLTIIVLTAFSFFSEAQISSDSTKRILYCFAEMPLVFMKTQPYQSKYTDYGMYIIERRSYSFKTPSLGVGFAYRGKRIFLRTEFSLWYGFKQLSYNYNYRDFYGPPPQFQEANSYYDSFSGTAHFFNVDWNNSIGRRIGKRSAVFFGIKKNFMVYFTYTGTLHRTVETYQYGAWGSPVVLTDENTYTLEDGNITKHNNQVISDYLFYSLGYNYQFKTKSGKGILLEGALFIPLPTFEGDYSPFSFNLKFGYKLGK